MGGGRWVEVREGRGGGDEDGEWRRRRKEGVLLELGGVRREVEGGVKVGFLVSTEACCSRPRCSQSFILR